LYRLVYALDTTVSSTADDEAGEEEDQDEEEEEEEEDVAGQGDAMSEGSTGETTRR
jgi:hypothetical protein